MRNFLIILAILLAFGFIFSLVMPKTMHVESNITINRPVSEVYHFAKYIDNMDKVSVWMTMDPDMKKSSTGTDGEVGFISQWESNKKSVGSGEQEIKELMPDQHIKTELRFTKPNESTGEAMITTVPDGENSTIVTWSFDGDLPWPVNVMGPMIKSQLKGQLNTGLENMKESLEN